MITLQSTFEYSAVEQPPEQWVSVVVTNPLLQATLINPATLEASLDRSHSASTAANLALSSSTYSIRVPIDSVFSSPVIDPMGIWLRWLLKRDNGNPHIDALAVDFNANYRFERDGAVSLPALWFYARTPDTFDESPSHESPPFLEHLADDDIERYTYVVNKAVYLDFIGTLWPDLEADRRSILLFIINLLVDLDGDVPRLNLTMDGTEGEASVLGLLERKGFARDSNVFHYVTRNFGKLFDFPLRLPTVPRLEIAGNVHVNRLSDGTIPKVNFDFYHLSLEYGVGSEFIQMYSKQYIWDDTTEKLEDSVKFSFTEPVFRMNVSRLVTVKLKAFTGSEVFKKEFRAADPALRALDIAVPGHGPGVINSPQGGILSAGGKKLRGSVVALGKACTLKGSVLIEAKTSNDGDFSVVSASTSDKDGSFVLPYPYGQFVEAKAVSSLGTSSYTSLKVTPGSSSESIASDFIYILLQGQLADAPKQEDCNCNPKTVVDRLPSQDDLLQSNQFTQDVGSGCVNLTTPNRTLREFQYTALVRHTDPDVANYTMEAQTLPPQGPDDVETVQYILVKQGKVDRQMVDLNTPIQWEDLGDENEGELEVYQAVTVATGHILHYKSEFKADGYSLGDLVYSLPLAPGQKKQIVTLDSSHTLLGTESQSLSNTEQLANNLISDRSIVDQIAGNIGEDLTGSSSASTSGVSAGLGAAGSMGAFGASLGVAGGYSNSNSRASQNSSRNVSQFFSEKLRQSLQQNAASYRQQNSTVVTAVRENQTFAATTETVGNHNHCHSLTMMYFEVLRHFAIFQELVDVEECVFVPLLMTKFSIPRISRWADALAPRLLPLPGNTYLKPFSYSYGQPKHPLLPGFDAAERVRTTWATVDYPTGRYCDEAMDKVWGEFDLVVSLPRPVTRYDNILSLPVATKTTYTREYDPKQVMKDTALTILSFGLGGGDGKVDVPHVLQTRAKIFDGFMHLDENWETVPPARCIRIKSFTNITPVPDPSGTSINLDPIADFFSNDGQELNMWLAYAELAGYTKTMEGLRQMMKKFFTMQLIGDWDSIWYKNVAPRIYRNILSLIQCSLCGFDSSSLSEYAGPGERVLKASFETNVTLTRAAVTRITFTTTSASAKELSKNLAIFRFQSVRIYYSTAHYNGMMYGGSLTGDILDDAGATINTLPTEAEKRNPRKEDRFLTQRLITHLNRNLEYYNRVLWSTMDSQRRYLLLDGFKIETFDKYGVHEDFRSLSSVLKNQLIGIVGNSLVFPVAPGYHVGQAFVVDQPSDSEGHPPMSESLLDHYRPDEPAAPYRMSIPTRGIYSEAVMGQCDSCEKIKPESSQDWTRFTTDEPTPFNPVTAPVPTITDYNPQVKDFAQPMVQIQNAPTAPDPAVGLRALTDLMGKSGVFKDITGLDNNQKNAMQTYLSNQENVRSMAQAASALGNMVNQAHNTANSGKIMDTVNTGHAQGAISDADRNQLTKDHVQQMIDGGATKAAELAEKKAQAKPSVSEKIAQAAIDQNRDMTATIEEPDNTVQTVSLKGKNGSQRTTLAQVSGFIAQIKQPDDYTCWAAVTTMMASWKWQVPIDIEKAVQMAGEDYVDKFKAHSALSGPDGEKLAENLGLETEGGGSYMYTHYVDLMKKYGPIWVTIDADASGSWSPHAIIVIKIEGYDAAPEEEVILTIIDPATGSTKPVSYAEHRKAFTQTLTDANPRASGVDQVIGMQILHWPYDISASVGYNVGHTQFKSKPPVHENLCLWAMRLSSKMKLDPSITPGSDQPTNEFLRGVYWNDDPASLLFDLRKNDNYNEATGLLWSYDFDKAGRRGEINPDNVIGRSHFGDLQFLHAMGSKMGEVPSATFDKIMLWAEIMYKVSIDEDINSSTTIENLGINTEGYRLDSFFTRNTWPTNKATISELLAPHEIYAKLDIKRRALGTILHLVQDSFARGRPIGSSRRAQQLCELRKHNGGVLQVCFR